MTRRFAGHPESSPRLTDQSEQSDQYEEHPACYRPSGNHCETGFEDICERSFHGLTPDFLAGRRLFTETIFVSIVPERRLD
jgi:hypothetical protein